MQANARSSTPAARSAGNRVIPTAPPAWYLVRSTSRSTPDVPIRFCAGPVQAAATPCRNRLPYWLPSEMLWPLQPIRCAFRAEGERFGRRPWLPAPQATTCITLPRGRLPNRSRTLPAAHQRVSVGCHAALLHPSHGFYLSQNGCHPIWTMAPVSHHTTGAQHEREHHPLLPEGRRGQSLQG